MTQISEYDVVFQARAFRVSRQIATSFTAWLVFEIDFLARFNGLAPAIGLSQKKKDVKTPFNQFEDRLPRAKAAWLSAAKRGKAAKAAWKQI